MAAIEPMDTTRIGLPTSAKRELEGGRNVVQFASVRPDNRCTRGPVELINELPWHRMFALMLTQGKTNKDAAAFFGRTVVECSIVRQQPWFKQILLQLTHEAGEDLLAQFEKQAGASLQVVVDIRDDEEAPKNVRLAAAESILSRLLGRKTDATIRRVEPKDPNTEEADLLRKISSLEKQTGVASGQN